MTVVAAVAVVEGGWRVSDSVCAFGGVELAAVEVVEVVVFNVVG